MVIGKVCRRGTDARRLLVYLFTEGQAGERGLESDHADARVIAGYDELRVLEPARGLDGRADVTRLASLLNAPLVAGGVGKDAKPVYHLAISAAPSDRVLTDREWADIAAEYVDQLGLAPRGDLDAVRWVAVRHADNHIHVVATLVRQDGRRVFPHNDFYKSRAASLCVEKRYSLTQTSPADRTADRETTRGGRRKHEEAVRASARTGRPAPTGPDREVLRGRVRAALIGSSNWEQFADRLRNAGVLVRERYSTVNDGEITGYAVALPAEGDRGQSVWFGGGKLAPDVTLPQLQARWGTPVDGAPGQRGQAKAHRTPEFGEPPVDLSYGERQRLWGAVREAVSDAQERIHEAAHPKPGATAADRDAATDAAQAAASAASDVLNGVSGLFEGAHGRRLRAAAHSYDRAARDLRRRTVPSTRTSRAVRSAASTVLRGGLVTNASTRQLLQLMSDLAALAQTLGQLREAQGRAAQAKAARQAAEQLVDEAARRGSAAHTVASQFGAAHPRGGGIPTPVSDRTPGTARSAQKPSSASR